MSIVFYIRAKFEESIDNKVVVDATSIHNTIETFNKRFKIDLITYRKRVHQIQLDNLRKISDKIIYNSRECYNDDDPWAYSPYTNVQAGAKLNILKLKDDDVIVPLDDDDWVSPDILNLKYETDMTIWRTASLQPRWPGNKITVFGHIPARAVPYENLSAEDTKHCLGVLSNCVAFKAGLVKFALKKGEHSRRLLQRHNQPRLLLREKEFRVRNVQETVIDKCLSVYVKHAGNITNIKSIYTNNNCRDYDEYIDSIKSEEYRKAVEQLPEPYSWSKEYYLKLWELNQLL